MPEYAHRWKYGRERFESAEDRRFRTPLIWRDA
jgi:hypothetical protein